MPEAFKFFRTVSTYNFESSLLSKALIGALESLGKFETYQTIEILKSLKTFLKLSQFKKALKVLMKILQDFLKTFNFSKVFQKLFKSSYLNPSY